MSYALELAADASRALSTLPVDVQEEVFDVLERVAREGTGGAGAAGTEVVARQERLIYRTEKLACDVYLYYTLHHDRRTVHLDRLAAVLFDER